MLIFIDDYFNCLTVGSVMRPVTDSQRISRAKLAYLIDATAAPDLHDRADLLVGGRRLRRRREARHRRISGIQLFIEAIPYNFYSLLTIVFVIALVVHAASTTAPWPRHELKACRRPATSARWATRHEEG